MYTEKPTAPAWGTYQTPAERAAAQAASLKAANSPAAMRAKEVAEATAQAEAQREAAKGTGWSAYKTPDQRAEFLRTAEPSNLGPLNPNPLGDVDPLYQNRPSANQNNPTVRAAAQEAVANKPMVSEDIMNEILNRKPHPYNPNADALYQIYKDRYLTAGNIAMKDTMGKAAALTGGYGNTYVQTVGQQVYDDYAARAADKIPELEQLAYERWAREGDELRNNYNLLYGREQDQAAADWKQKEWDLQLERYRVADEQWAAQHGLDVAEFEEKKYEFQENLALEWANMDLKQKELALDKWYKEQGIQLSQAELAEKARQFDSEMNYKYYAEGNDIAYKYAALAQDQAQHNEDMSYKYANLNKTSGNSPSGSPAAEKTLMSYFDNDQDAVNEVVRDVAGMMTNPAQWSTDRIFAYLEANYGEEIGARIYSLARTKLGMTN